MTRAAPVVRLALTLVIVGACILAAGCWRVYSNTWDEPEHLAAGVELLDRGIYEYDTEHPPLGRIFIALGPYLAGARSFDTPGPEGTREGVDILYSGANYERYLTLARLGMLPFLALLLFVTWWWARALFASQGTALLAVVLLASVPPILGNGALASLDVAAAATMLLAFYTLQRWIVSGSHQHAAFFGLAAGVAVATKFSAVPFVGLALPLLALLRLTVGPRAATAAGRRPHAARGWLLGLAIVGGTALLPILLVYGPRAEAPAGVAVRFDWAVAYLLQERGLDHQFGVLLQHLWLPRPFKDLVNGVVAVKAHNDSGHLSFLLGEVSRSGWWYFYVVALAVKTPLPLLVAGIAGLAGLAWHGWGERNLWKVAPALLVVTIVVFASAFSRINIGVRHVLIVYPFFALGAAWVVARAWAALASARAPRIAMAGRTGLLALLAWQLSTLATAYPDYLPYFNEAVAHPERVLVDSDLDWGQDLRRLEWRAAQLKIAHLQLAYRGTALLSKEPLPPFTNLPPDQPATGWVAISALARTRSPQDYAWTSAYQPVERIGKSIDLYYIP
ncbi:MAG TPA: phospholipid carrier-dependent glycosyltransferase [Steroidobacteraceae bacterium]|nr:phospholipid carrier-dependent glycosyltransferase [Steroidobacteraceae bacterium]